VHTYSIFKETQKILAGFPFSWITGLNDISEGTLCILSNIQIVVNNCTLFSISCYTCCLELKFGRAMDLFVNATEKNVVDAWNFFALAALVLMVNLS